MPPSGRYSLVDLYRAGGIPAVLKRLENSLHMDCITVSGKPWSKLLKKAQIQDEKIIFPLEKPLHEEGGTVILHGNLARAMRRGQTIRHFGFNHAGVFRSCDSI